MKHFRLITYLLLTFATFNSGAQTARIYTSADGLANSHIHDIFQDSKGFIWFATENGLSRFDGIKFNNATFNRSRTNSIASNTVRAVFEDCMGTFWVGTSAGLQIFDTEHSSFAKINLEDWSVPDSDQHITAVLEIIHNGTRKIVAATSGHGIYIVDAESHETDIESQSLINNALPSKFISKMFLDSRSRLWVATDTGGISIFEINGMSSVTDLWANGMDRESADIINSITEDKSTGNIYLGTTNSGMLVWDADTGRIRRSKGHTKTGFSIMSMLPNNLVTRYGDNTYLVGLENHGIRLFNAETESISNIRFSNVPHNTSGWKVHELMEDNQGNVWVGAIQVGAMIIPKSMFGFRHMDFSTSESGRIYNRSITSVISDEKRDCLWVGTDGGGIFRTDHNGNNYTNLSTENTGISNNSIMSLALDNRGTLWVATYLGGLYTYTPERGFRQFKDQNNLGSEKIYCLAYNSLEDMLYVGTHGNGFAKVDARNEKIEQKWDDDSNKWISYLSIDSSGLVWIGTYNGPKAYDSRVNSLTEYELVEGKSIRVNSIFETKDGNIWIGTGEGLVCMDRATKEKRIYTEVDGLSSNSVSSILEDNSGYLWISTLNGISRLDLKAGTFRNFYQYDGLQDNEFNAKAAYKAANGRMYFGGINGLTAFNPQYVERRETPVPPLYLSRLTVMNKLVRYDQAMNDNILDKHISEATNITLDNDADLFTLEFSVLEYTNPQKVAYKYMLEGLDKDWNSTLPGSQSITYTNLPSGRYKLAIKAFYEGEPENFSYREIGIRVLSPWYLSFWAWLIYFSICIFLAFVFIEFRHRRIALKVQKEESEIKEMKLQMFTNISHEIRTPLTLVMNPLKKMRENETDPTQKDLYNLMYRNSLRILRLVNQLMDMRKVDNGQMKLHFVETDIVYFVKDIMQSFDNLAVNKNIEFSLECEQDSVNLWIDQGNFDKIIFNILSNAFKYTPDGGFVKIGISQTDSNVGFHIENSGDRIDDKHLDKIFDRYYQADIKDAKMGSGVGLHLTKMLVGLHHGNISVCNTDRGVAFDIMIPMGNSHLSEEEMRKPENHKDLYTKNITTDQEEHSGNEDITYSVAEEIDGQTKVNKTRKRIILVDDDSEMRAYLKQELQSIYNVDVCSNGKEAWAKISTSIPDAVITDLIMDKMDGAELCQKIKKNPGTNHIPVILLTSSADELSQKRCIDSGADRFFTKPISLEILKSAVAGAIATRETIRNKYSRDLDYGYGDLKMADSNNELVSKVISTIRKNIENPEFSVEELSKEVGMSRVHLNRKLKETMNISPSNLIRSIRLKQAAYLLINNKVNISEVAYKVGFSTHSYFSNSFHDYFGMTPKEFTNQYMNCTDEETLKKLFG